MVDPDIANIRATLKFWLRFCRDNKYGGFNDELEEVHVAIESLDKVEEWMKMRQLELFENKDA